MDKDPINVRIEVPRDFMVYPQEQAIARRFLVSTVVNGKSYTVDCYLTRARHANGFLCWVLTEGPCIPDITLREAEHLCHYLGYADKPEKMEGYARTWLTDEIRRVVIEGVTS